MSTSEELPLQTSLDEAVDIPREASQQENIGQPAMQPQISARDDGMRQMGPIEAA